MGVEKTTLLNIIGGLDRYTSGDLIINGKSTKKFKDRDWDAYRNYKVGFVFQSYNLIGHQTILLNVELALTIVGNYLAENLSWNDILVTLLNMACNFILEYLYDKYVVFRGSIDTKK